MKTKKEVLDRQKRTYSCDLKENPLAMIIVVCLKANMK